MKEPDRELEALAKALNNLWQGAHGYGATKLAASTLQNKPEVVEQHTAWQKILECRANEFYEALLAMGDRAANFMIALESKDGNQSQLVNFLRPAESLPPNEGE